MNRRDFLKNAGLAGLGTGLSSPLFAADKPAAVDPTSSGSPAVYAPTSDGATVIWPVPVNSVGWVSYVEVGADGPERTAKADGFGFIANGEHVVRVRLRGLTPGKTYRYRTHTRPVCRTPKEVAAAKVTVGEPRELRILNPDAKETSFCVWNDTHDIPATLKALAELTRARPADFLLWNGDVVGNAIGRASDIPGVYLQPRGGVDLSMGPPVFLSNGNHDVRGPEANRLSGYVDYPEGRPYFSFRSGPVAGIVLDTGEDKPDDHPYLLGLGDFAALIRAQGEWLAREIEKPHLKDAPYKVVFCHIPLRWKKEENPDYANGGFDHWSRRGREAWHASLVKWGAQLVVSGHTHERHHMPASPEFPYAQLVGGGPGRAGFAGGDRPFLITAQAGPERMTFRLLDVPEGRVVFETSFPPLRV
jgi:hypothetical protein